VVILILAGAAFGLARAVGGTSAGPLTGCEVTSNPPLHDRAFNQAVYDGLTAAGTKWGIGVRDKVSASEDEWKRNVNDLVQQRCGLIVTLGTIVGRDTVAAAKANPRQRFVSTDAAGVQGTSNLLRIKFKAEQAAFLAGYLSAGVTKSHTVGTYGGIPLPTVTPFMDGFATGVLHYNRVHGANVRLVGWDPKTRTGTFVSQDQSGFGVFVNPTAARDITTELVGSGADVIFPVDGPGGETGSCRAVQQHRDVLLIGVDTDQHYATPDCVAQWLTSVLKVFRQTVFLAMQQVVEHGFKGGMLEGTLENGGVGLAPFYGLRSRVPLRLRNELGRVKQDIIKRSISINPRDYLPS
jgi:basic membrane protein A and related proteins